MSQDTIDASLARSPAASRERDIAPIAAAVAAILLGVFLVYGVGFASSDALHAAAHDVRHAFAFPCH